MVEVRLSVSTRDMTDGKAVSRSFSYINRKYIDFIPNNIRANPPTTIDYATFPAWALAVARGLATLSTNVFVDASIMAGWNLPEEVEP